LEFRIAQPPVWLAGLLIVVALLGHDLLMAAPVAHAVEAAAETDHRQHSAAQALGDVTGADPHGHHESPHPTSCGIGGMARLQPVDQLGVPELSTVASIATCQPPASAPTRAFLWEEPRWPPGTRRALLQVYRI